MNDVPEKPESGEDKLLPNSSADEFFGRIKHDFRRPKPSEEAVASALQAIQKLTGETVVHTVADKTHDPSEKCSHCGASNSGMNRFCGYCGALMTRNEKSQLKPAPGPAEGDVQHFYHHHYHHHLFPGDATGKGGSDIQWKTQIDGSALEQTLSDVNLEAARDSEQAIRSLVREWSVFFNSKRVDDLVKLYSGDAIVLRPNAPPAHGEAAIRSLLQSALDAGLGDVELDCVDLGIVDDFASVAGRSKMLVPSAPAKRNEETGKYLMVARNESGGWKIVADCWCMDAPKAQPATPVLPVRARN